MEAIADEGLEAVEQKSQSILVDLTDNYEQVVQTIEEERHALDKEISDLKVKAGRPRIGTTYMMPPAPNLSTVEEKFLYVFFVVVM